MSIGARQAVPCSCHTVSSHGSKMLFPLLGTAYLPAFPQLLPEEALLLAAVLYAAMPSCLFSLDSVSQGFLWGALLFFALTTHMCMHTNSHTITLG